MTKYVFTKIKNGYVRGNGYGFMVLNGEAEIDESQPHMVELAQDNSGKPAPKPKQKRGK